MAALDNMKDLPSGVSEAEFNAAIDELDKMVENGSADGHGAAKAKQIVTDTLEKYKDNLYLIFNYFEFNCMVNKHGQVEVFEPYLLPYAIAPIGKMLLALAQLMDNKPYNHITEPIFKNALLGDAMQAFDTFDDNEWVLFFAIKTIQSCTEDNLGLALHIIDYWVI